MKIFRIPDKKIIHYFNLMLGLMIVIIFIFVTLFLYNNFYKIIIQSEEVVILKSQVAPVDINMNKFNNILEKLKEKTKEKNLDISIKF